MSTPLRSHRLIAALVIAVALAASCGGSTDSTSTNEGAAPADSPQTESAAGIRSVSADEGAAIQAEPPSDLVILDVRTPEEFAEGHLDGAILVDFYDEDFAVQLGELNPDVPYLLYCRSGNRSGQTAQILDGLGFVDVADVDGGIIAWNEAGHPLVKA